MRGWQILCIGVCRVHIHSVAKSERKRVSGLIRAAEYLFLENLALKLILDHREVKNWPLLLDRIMHDREMLAGVHLKFADVYRDVESSENPETALDDLLATLPRKRVS